MCKKLAVLFVALIVAGTSQAGVVLLVSDSLAPGVEGEDHLDDAFVSFLEGLGHTVDTSGMGEAYREGNAPFADDGKVAALESADLVVVSRRTSSGSYDNDRKNWNELGTPLLLMNGYLVRGEVSSKRWGWAAGAAEEASLSATTLDLGDMGTVESFDFSGAPTPGGAPKPAYLAKKDGSSEFPDMAEVLGTFDGYDMLVDIPAGTDLDAHNGTVDKYGVAGGRRAFLGHWGYDADGPYDWSSFITDGYEDVVGQTVNTLIRLVRQCTIQQEQRAVG